MPLILIKAPSCAYPNPGRRTPVGNNILTAGKPVRFYTRQHPLYCGIDLHARTMYLCILNQAGEIVLHKNMKCDPKLFLAAIAPFSPDLVVGVECIFTWYWMADLCAAEWISFVLGHALYMKAIHGGKAKNDRIDAHKIAVLLRGGTFPQAYVYPPGMRSTRDLLRRRLRFVRHHGALLAHIQSTNSQCNLPDFGGRIVYKANRPGVAARFEDESVRKSIEVNLALVDHYDEMIRDLELHITRAARQHDAARRRVTPTS
jgi:transposase